ncbi:D-aminoacyl-tRNA deacylase [Phocicoccus pinnipedialis]|uniref:D-aminoacyl-tRNA deacylase n=1 Tax=Phocicoccus pinnipedialis TaxID=110845 RepID=A0A6V7REP1_9BACL|nr:D-aminoacyl-tRNA deacylase [Jeotgalicoccus pinnipedialis]MBP1939208.1 D-tyrosyl-tRNA(Tyr) deacylase [Jeotgalicoccus pinnipedialis]CAD2076305.1 D-tyrosyl-tRNA(Tyr) deacylase [Jeotgalicoccus pinnipedialis]
MKIVLQKVSHASVSTNELFNEIHTGYLLLVGVSTSSTEADAIKLAEKIANARNFEDDEGKINRSIKEVNGDILSVSQFTLYADVKKGNRPSFTDAAPGEKAQVLYEKFNEALENQGLLVKTGFFGENMDVKLTNDGPITIIYESKEGKIL